MNLSLPPFIPNNNYFGHWTWHWLEKEKQFLRNAPIQGSSDPLAETFPVGVQIRTGENPGSKSPLADGVTLEPSVCFLVLTDGSIVKKGRRVEDN